MELQSLLARLKEKPDPALLSREAGEDPDLLEGLIQVVRTQRSPVRYPCTKAVRLLSEAHPELVYPYFSDMVFWMRNDNSFVKWDGILTLANLAGVDWEGRFPPLFPEYLDLIRDPQMITAANAAAGLARLAEVYPQQEPEITRRLLEVPGIQYLRGGQPSPECGRIMAGHVLDAFDRYFDRSHSQGAILEFARTQLSCPRKGVAKKAAAFLKRHAAL